MKKLIALIGVAVLSLATVNIVSAQVPTYSLQSFSPTNGLSTGGAVLPTGWTWFVQSASNNLVYIDASRSQVIAISSVGSAGANGATNLYLFAPTLDGLTYDTNLADALLFSNVITAAYASNTVVKSYTVGGVQGYRLAAAYVVANAGSWTNGPQYVGLKISSP